ncbi:MAG: RsmE family RNA methyltransferase, partial [Deltaproteobacteria bacterium]
MARFLLKAELICGAEVELSYEESHHLAKVLRMEVGSECELVDGAGTVAKASVVDNHPKRARCLILKVNKEKNLNKIHIAFAIPKSNALDFIIHRCTEVGVASFQPLTTDHSLKINSWNETRWERVVTETAKQCQEIYFPVVLAPLTLESWLFQKRDTNRELIYCDEEARHNTLDSISVEKEVDLL